MLDHVTLRTTDIEGTRAFLEALLDLKPGPRPASFNFPGYWLYHGEAPIVHLVSAPHACIDYQAEGIDHFAVRLTDYEKTCQKLEDLNAGFTRVDLPEINERRLFTKTPAGILIELCFNT